MIKCAVKVIFIRVLNGRIDQCGDRIHEPKHLLPNFSVIINPESEQVSLKEVFVTALKHVLEPSNEVRGALAWVIIPLN